MGKTHFLTIGILLSMCIISACSKNSENDIGIEPRLTLEESDLFKKHKLSDIVEDYRLIPLETTRSSIISSIGKVIFDSTSIYIKEFSGGGSIFEFDLNGKFIRKMGAKGRGRGEYISIYDFCITHNKRTVILDGESKKIIFFAPNGEYERDQIMPFYADGIRELNDSVFVFLGSSFDDRVILWNHRQERVVGSFIEHDEKFSESSLVSVNNDILWRQDFQSVFHKVTEKGLIPTTYIDFKEYSFDEKKLWKGVYGMYFISPKMAVIEEYYENDKYVIFDFYCGFGESENDSDSPTLYYFKETGEKRVLHPTYYEDDLTFFNSRPLSVCSFTSDGDPVVSPPHYFWMEGLDSLKNVENNPSLDKLRGRLAGVDNSHNPVLIVYKLKDI